MSSQMWQETANENAVVGRYCVENELNAKNAARDQGLILAEAGGDAQPLPPPL